MIREVEVVNFRVVEQAVIDLDTRVSAVVGCNGAGKTSVLEALFLLGHGRSHRNADRRAMIRRDAEFLRIVAGIEETADEGRARIGVELRRSGELLASVNREQVSALSRVLHLAPVMMIDGDVQEMFAGGATYRRRLLDWGVFHVEQQFSATWRRYQRTLRQRNAALKAGGISQAQMWDESVREFGDALDSLRASYVARLEPYFQREMAGLLDGPASLAYRKGWIGSLEASLEESLPRDSRLGFTSVGPHRADLLPGIGGVSASQLSRGQQKLLAIGLLLSQARVHAATPGTPRVTLLIDDAGADLDVDNLGKLYGALQSLPAQLVVTAIDERALQLLNIGRMFHVEHGTIRLIP